MGAARMSDELTPQEPAASGFFNVQTAHEQAFALEHAIKNECDLIEGEVVHHHSHGVYGRELRIPAGSVVVGHIHKYENMNVLLEGEMTVVTDDGPKRVGPGFLIVSPPGTKRAAYAHTDCRWLTVHGTHETDIEKIEQQFIVHTEQEYLAFRESQQLLEGN
jgi:quercetin dioxygenase-like cupin family protein